MPADPDFDRQGRYHVLLSILIALVTVLVFSPALRDGFINWDDDVLILNNPNYRGFGWTHLRWMFTTLLGGNYQPLYWLTYAVDYALWGMNPVGYHLTNILFHAANAVLFFHVAWVLLALSSSRAPLSGRRQASRTLAAAGAALLFALHPLRVESVVWVTGRKDVLSGFLYFCAILAYLRRHAGGDSSQGAWLALCWTAFGLALLAKGMVLTLPVALLVLDIYPLRRLAAQPRRWLSADQRPVLLEKVPFFAASLVVGVATYLGQHRAGAISVEPLSARCAKVLFRLAYYLVMTAWPRSLGPCEAPVPFDPLGRPYIAAGALVALITACAVLGRRRWPALAASWVYYAATLAPILGLIPFGQELVSDRYTYLACLPWPLLAVAGLGWGWSRCDRRGRCLLAAATGLALAGLAALTRFEIGYWRDSETFWSHALRLRPRTSFALYNLGVDLYEKGRREEAVALYRAALEIKPNLEMASNNLGNGLKAQGRLDDAVSALRAGLSLTPQSALLHGNLGNALAAQGKEAEAVEQYLESLRIRPDSAEMHFNLGTAFVLLGQDEPAIRQFREALRLKPDYPQAHGNWAAILAREGRVDEAIAHFREALRIDPGFALAQKNLDFLLNQRSDRRATRSPAALAAESN